MNQNHELNFQMNQIATFGQMGLWTLSGCEGKRHLEQNRLANSLHSNSTSLYCEKNDNRNQKKEMIKTFSGGG